MKTVLVVYTSDKLSKKESQTLKRYCFNTRSAIKVGMMLETDLYTTPMQVVEIFPKSFKYVDLTSGVMSNRKAASTRQVEVREIRLVSHNVTDIIEVTEL